MIIAGAVNGVPTTGDVIEGSDQILDIANNGSADTLEVQTDGNDWNEDGVSSRVAIIGGTTPGRDHFPFPVTDSDGDAFGHFGNHTVYPLDFELSDAMYLWARVKRWHFEVTVYYQIVTGTDDGMGGETWDFGPTQNAGCSFKFRLPLDHFPSAPTPPTMESDLVLTPELVYAMELNLGGTFTDSVFDVTDYSDFNTDVSGVPFAFRLTFVPYPVWHPDTGKFTFYIECVCGSNDQTASTSKLPDDSDYPALLNEDFCILNSAGVDFGDFTFGARATENIAEAERSGEIKFVDMQLTIQAQEFWPYATRAGDPVYNTTTGAQIRDPLS